MFWKNFYDIILCMKKTLTIIALYFISVSFASASIVVNPTSEFFTFETAEALEIRNTDITEFNFDVLKGDSSKSIANWEIRVWCEDEVKIMLKGSSENICNKDNLLFNSQIVDDRFALKYSNSSGKDTKFSLKLKAFDKNGNWLHSQKKVFFWK